MDVGPELPVLAAATHGLQKACCMVLTDASHFGSPWAKAMYLARHSTWHAKVNVDASRPSDAWPLREKAASQVERGLGMRKPAEQVCSLSNP